jgi:hypothetical protein
LLNPSKTELLVTGTRQHKWPSFKTPQQNQWLSSSPAIAFLAQTKAYILHRPGNSFSATYCTKSLTKNINILFSLNIRDASIATSKVHRNNYPFL